MVIFPFFSFSNINISSGDLSLKNGSGVLVADSRGVAARLYGTASAGFQNTGTAFSSEAKLKVSVNTTQDEVSRTVSFKTGSITLQEGIQTYDLNALWANVSESGNSIEIKKVFYEGSPAVTRYFDPYAGTGDGSYNMLDSFGWGNNSPAVQFMMMPMYADLLKVQAIEFNCLF